ncbi:MAG: GAF domain-containing SpoIIE family protein phosphatase [Planctomycetota bacterium]
MPNPRTSTKQSDAVNSQQSDAVGSAQESLKLLCQRLKTEGCSSATLFVRDPLLPYYLRMVADCGVCHREVMHGPLSTHSIIGSLMMDPAEIRDEVMRGPLSTPSMVDSITMDPVKVPDEPQWFARKELADLHNSMDKSFDNIAIHEPLYCCFIVREKVASAALLRFIIGGEIQACVWINFSKPRDKFANQLQKTIRSFNKIMSKSIPNILQQLTSQVPSRIRRFENLHKAAKQFPASTSGTTLEDYLHSFLDAALDVCDIDELGFGTIYLLDDSDVLHKAAQRGPVVENAKTSFSVKQKEGVVSLAAARGTPLIVDHPATNLPYYVSVDKPNTLPTTREVIVPLIVASKVIGVMNLESKQEQPKFNENDVFDLMAAGFRVASSIRVAEQMSKSHEHRNLRMLEIASRAIFQSEPTDLREDLQAWAKEEYGADQCSIWQWSNVGHRFVPENRPDSPQPRGFSQLIQETRCTLWWSASVDPEALDIQFWNNKDGQWGPAHSNNSWLPEKVNAHLKDDDIAHQLGMPILFQDRCVGVVWFKFRDSAMIPPLPSHIRLAKGLTAEIGLILQLKQRHEEVGEEAAVEGGLQKLNTKLFPTGPFSFEGGDGYAILQSIGPIGGDFYEKVELKDATGFIVGDGEGHGLIGATAMLPLHTAFTICAKKFLSPQHTLWQMNDLLEGVEHVAGTAICFVVDCSRETPRLIVSSAAHPKMMIFRPGQSESLPKGGQEGFQIGVGRQMYYDNLLDESRFDLEVGDTLVAVTDGVIEAGEKGEMGQFGADRISLSVLQARSKEPKAIALAIKDAMLKHCDNVLFDDYTILVIRITGSATHQEFMKSAHPIREASPLSVGVDLGDAPRELGVELFLALTGINTALGGSGIKVIHQEKQPISGEEFGV